MTVECDLRRRNCYQQLLLKTGKHLPVASNVWLCVKGGKNMCGIGVFYAIEAVIGHNKTDGLLGQNFLKSSLRAQVNAVMSAIGYNFRLFLKLLKRLLRQIVHALLQAFVSNFALRSDS